MSETQQKVLNLIYGKTGVLPQLEDTLDVMKLDSLAMAELTVEFERSFAISIDDDILNVEDVRGLIAYIERKTQECSGKQ
jgi:acyl carrier protein